MPLVATLFVLLLSASTPTDPEPTPVADHHIHVPSDSTAAYLREVTDLDLKAKSGDDVIKFLDAAGIEKGVLLSLGYMFGRPGTDFSNEYARVRRENNYVARQAAQYPDRLVAFCGVDPLATYAMREIERCARKPHLEGLKLQLANSKVDLRDSSDVEKLSDVFGAANRKGLPLVVHLWTGADYGREEAEIFIREVLPEASDVTVQVAHMGGKGMFDPATASAMKAFVHAIETGRPGTETVLFDLGAVTADPQAAIVRGDTARARGYRKTHRRTARWIQAVGPDRVIFGSDYFARQVPEYVDTLRDLPVPDSTLRAVFDNGAPYLL